MAKFTVTESRAIISHWGERGLFWSRKRQRSNIFFQWKIDFQRPTALIGAEENSQETLQCKLRIKFSSQRVLENDTSEIHSKTHSPFNKFFLFWWHLLDNCKKWNVATNVLLFSFFLCALCATMQNDDSVHARSCVSLSIFLSCLCPSLYICNQTREIFQNKDFVHSLKLCGLKIAEKITLSKLVVNICSHFRLFHLVCNPEGHLCWKKTRWILSNLPLAVTIFTLIKRCSYW